MLSTVVVEVKENLNWTPPAQIFWKEISIREVQEKKQGDCVETEKP